MKTCPQCDTGYPDSQTACPVHGHLLNETRELRPGMVIHKTYRIVRKLGQGGMGTVYLAQHILMGEPRALKFLSPELSRDQAFTNRFLREVRTLRQIRNSYVVDCGDLEAAEDDSLFFSMEFVDGPDLRAFLRDYHPDQAAASWVPPVPRFWEPGIPPLLGSLPVPLALSIARQIAEGLGAAHSKGMVHRDIKPENILMARDGDTWLPKIADFGIVATKESSTAYTRTGGTLLTMAYAAPEQWRGTPAASLDGRTDLYALGGLLYEMLTGQTPFHAENYESWAEQHRNTPPQPPSTLRPNLADCQGLDALVLHLLAKDRNDRPANVAELLGLIDAMRYLPSDAHRETVAEDAGKWASEKRSRRVPIWVWAASAIVILMVAPAMWFSSQHLKHSDPPEHLPLDFKGWDKNPPPSAVQPQQVQDANSKPNSPAAYDSLRVISTIKIPTNPSAPTTEVPQQPKPAPAEDSKPSTPKPETSLEPKPKHVEDFKPQVQMPSFAEIEQNAATLFSQKRYLEATPLFDQACAGGNGKACDNLGSMYGNGKGVAHDDSKAVTFYSKACDAGNAEGCNDLGVMYESGRGVGFNRNDADCGRFSNIDQCGFAKDYPQAITLYSKACNAGIADSCWNLGRMYLNGNGVTEDYSQALTLYTRACVAGSADGCSSIGLVYQKGYEVQKDKAKAREFYSKGCSMGSQRGCDQLKKMK